MSFIVWEWESDQSIWVPYSPEVSHLLEDASQNNKDVIDDIGKADPNLSCYEVSLKNRTQTRLETGKNRHIRRRLYPSSHPCMFGIVWEWLSDFGTWTAYGMETAGHIEKEYSRGGSHLDLENTPLRIPNKVDFGQMVQINKFTQFKRHIQRRNHRTSYPLDIGLSSSNSNSASSMKGFSPSSSSHSPVHNSSLSSASGPNSSRNSPGIKSLQSQLSNLKSPSEKGGFDTKTQSLAQQHLTYGAGAVGCTSFGVEKDKLSSKTSPSKQRGRLVTKTQSHTKQDFSSSATLSGNENKIHENKRKKLKLNLQHDEDPLISFCRDVKETTDKDCSICFEKLKDISGFHDNSSKPPDSDIKELKKCKHRFHGTCLLEFMKSGSKNGWIQCPTCKAIHGIKHGNQPKDGTMDVSKSSQSLPGHHGHGMIVITYSFRTGIQDKEHPHPGKVYYASGFPRVCYLPDNKKGQKVLKLLKKAWDRRLIFTVATSNTTGQEDTVVWNEIHHKTEPFSNISGHGFPDPNYLDNVLAELAVQGVDDSDDDDDDDEV